MARGAGQGCEQGFDKPLGLCYTLGVWGAKLAAEVLANAGLTYQSAGRSTVAPLTKEGSHSMAKKILVVDDERHIVRLVQVNLERVGYEILTA